jgi:hypothetical protein
MLNENEFLGPYSIRSTSKSTFIRDLLEYHLYYGDDFRVECPQGSGRMMNLFEVSKELFDRLTRTFPRDEQGRHRVYGRGEKSQTDPHWRYHILFFEYFHGDNGAGLGASHQAGWTGLVAKFIQLYGFLDANQALEGGKGVGSWTSHSKPTRTGEWNEME